MQQAPGAQGAAVCHRCTQGAVHRRWPSCGLDRLQVGSCRALLYPAANVSAMHLTIVHEASACVIKTGSKQMTVWPCCWSAWHGMAYVSVAAALGCETALCADPASCSLRLGWSRQAGGMLSQSCARPRRTCRHLLPLLPRQLLWLPATSSPARLCLARLRVLQQWLRLQVWLLLLCTSS